MISFRKYHIFFLAAFTMPFLFYAGIASADTSGQRTNFNVNPEFDKYKRTVLGATVRYISDRAYFYVDDGYWNMLGYSKENSLVNNMKVLADEFDKNIYLKETSLWGSEPNPGVDGDPKITILIEELVDTNGGYFDTANSYTKREVSNSNEREMIAINGEVLVLDQPLIKMFLAHEFQHMISFNQKEKKSGVSEEVWLNELRSEYSISAVGYNDVYQNSNLEHRISIFSSNQSDSLTEWPNKNPDYTMVTLFGEYLIEQFGSGILSETIKDPWTGIASLNKYFLDKKYSETFSDVFLNWLGALYLNDTSRNPKLGYKRAELKNVKALPEQKVFLSSGLREYSSIHYIKDWQPIWLEYDMGGVQDGQTSAKIDISGEVGQNFSASYLAFYDNGDIEPGKINIVGGKGSAYVLNSEKKLKKIVVLATKSTKFSIFRRNEPANFMNASISLVDTKDAQAHTLKDGALIKRPGEPEVYVIWGKYKRYLNPGVISLYGHLDVKNAIELEPALFDSYISSNYVKYANDEKVYAVWPDNTKHWLHMAPSLWDSSGRDWGAIFTINDLEVNYYKTGQEINR